MSMKKVMTTGFVAGAVALALSGAALSKANAQDSAEKEKCYGVVKAGKNDCADAAKTHTCATHATVDGSADEFVLLPKGVCEKLVNGKLSSAAGHDAGGDMMKKE